MSLFYNGRNKLRPWFVGLCLGLAGCVFISFALEGNFWTFKCQGTASECSELIAFNAGEFVGWGIIGALTGVIVGGVASVVRRLTREYLELR